MNEPLAFAGDNRTLRLNGDKLVALRRGRGLSREQLADASTGVHRLSIATIKRAEHGNPVYLETARRLAGLLGVPIQSLLDTHEAVEQERASRATLAPLEIAPWESWCCPFAPLATMLTRGAGRRHGRRSDNPAGKLVVSGDLSRVHF